MPNIKRTPISDKIVQPSVRPSVSSAASRAQAGVGQALAGAAEQIGSTVQQLQQKEAQAERTLKSLEMARGFQSEVSDFNESYQGRQDFENFETDADTQLQSLRQKYLEQAGGDKVLQIAFERSFNQQSSTLNNAVKAKKLQVMSDRAIGAFDVGFNESLQIYSEETDPVARDLIKQGIELDTAVLVDSGFMTQRQAEAKIQTFEDNAESVRADKLIEINPTVAEELLRSDDFADLDPKIRQQKIEKANTAQKAEKTAIRVAENQLKKEQKEARVALQNEENRKAGELFINGNVAAIVPYLTTTTQMSGEQLKAWSTAADTVSRRDDTETTDVQTAAEIVEINGMISRNADPAALLFRISTGILPKEDKEQYLAKVSSGIKTTTEQGRNQGYRLIQDIINPKEDPLDFLQTPLETTAIASGQISFDNWIDDQKGAGKFPTLQEMKTKAIEIANSSQVSIASKIKFQEEFSKQAQAEILKATEERRARADAAN